MPGDRFVLCTDGLSDYFESEEFGKVFDAAPIEKVPGHLVEMANDRGGKDNISCIVLAVQGEPDDDAFHSHNQIDTLRQIPLFETLDYLEMIKLLNIMKIEDHARGGQIIRDGEASDRLFVIASGSVEVSKKGQKVATLGPGSFFGEMGLLDKSARSADVFAVEPTQLMTIPAAGLEALLSQQPSISRKLLWSVSEVLTKRLRATTQYLTEMGDDLVEGVFGKDFIDI
jgi:hypothetical protein